MIGQALALPGELTPEMFGAAGDGSTNDSAAFAALAARVNADGGGTIRMRQTTYIVGEQRPTFPRRAAHSFEALALLQFKGCRQPLVIKGNGARLRCAPGLRYGTFDPRSGEPTKHPMPYLGQGEVATPYDYMIKAEECSGPVIISDLELDGGLDQLQLGGTYGDTGWQIPAVGIYLVRNSGDEILSNLSLHHHAQDGLMISGLSDPGLAARVKRQLTDVRCEYNGRQGCSLIGGRGYQFRNCAFNHTARGRITSAPAAGLDIETEGEPNRAHSFLDCEFVDNQGCGMVADSGDSAGATFRRCRFVGTVNWSAWPNKPLFRFHDCTFLGSIVRCFSDPDPERATQFHDCRFTDNPRLSPNGLVYRQDRPDGSLADLSDSENVLFNRCSFLAEHGSVLPWSTRAIYKDCVMRQTTKSPGYPRGTFVGRSSIVGNVDLYNSRIVGELSLNGRMVAH